MTDQELGEPAHPFDPDYRSCPCGAVWDADDAKCPECGRNPEERRAEIAEVTPKAEDLIRSRSGFPGGLLQATVAEIVELVIRETDLLRRRGKRTSLPDYVLAPRVRASYYSASPIIDASLDESRAEWIGRCEYTACRYSVTHPSDLGVVADAIEGHIAHEHRGQSRDDWDHEGQPATPEERRARPHSAEPIGVRRDDGTTDPAPAGMCSQCGRPFAPWHDMHTEGPTMRHPFTPARHDEGSRG